MGIADIFITDQWEEFDELPLPLQKLTMQQKKLDYELHLSRYRKNLGASTGRPKTWPDQLLENIFKEVQEISKTDSYKEKKDPREKDPGITAYEIMLQNLYETDDMKTMISDWKVDDRTLRNWKKGHKKVAKAIKVRVDEHIKKKKIGT